MIGLHAAGITDVGQQREANEDSLHVGDSVFAVADGMGGHQAGEVASALALQPIAALDGRVFGDVEEARTALGDAVVQANHEVVDAAAHDDALHGMGTTLTAALFEGRRLHVAHVGDSRAYLMRAGEVAQLTRDHTFVQQLIDDGRITEDEVATHPHRSVITRAIGAREDVEVDLQTLDLQHDDAVLLCSDGLSSYVSEGDIAAVLLSDRSPVEIVTALVDAANGAGGPDNITAVLLTVVNEREDVAPYDPPGSDEHVAPQDEPTTGHDVVLGGTIEDQPTDRLPPQPRRGGHAGVAGAGAAAAAGAVTSPDGTADGDHPGTDDARPARSRDEAPDDEAADDARGRDATADDATPDDATADDATADDASSHDGSSHDADDDARRKPSADGPGRGREALVIRPDGDAGRMRPLPGPGPDESLVVDPAVRRRRIASVVVALVVVLGLFIGGGRWLLSRSFFVGLDGDTVAIYKGIPASLGPVELSWVFEETGLSADQLPDEQVRQLQDGIAAADGRDARSIVNRYREAAEEPDEEPTDDPADGPSPTATPSPSVSPNADGGGTEP